MTSQIHVRPVAGADYRQWRVLWDGYNAFYGRSGAMALDEKITEQTWSWFFDPASKVHAFVAEIDGSIVGLVHCIFHRSTSRLTDVCYLQDLYTSEAHRGKGIGRKLIEQVYATAVTAGSTRVYWNTQSFNVAGRALYEKVARHHDFIVYSHEL